MEREFETLKSLLERDRSVRRFDERRPLSYSEVEEIVSLTVFCASAANRQPLRYCIVTENNMLEKIYPLLKWAGYLTDWDGPAEGERPTAIVVQLLDTGLTDDCMCDDGLHLQAITLGATARGFGGCIIKAFNAPALAKVLSLPDNLKPLYVLALGYPAEKVVIERLEGDDIKYWRSADGVHHVPKREFSPYKIIK